MRNAALLLVLGLPLSGPDLLACGDKFLVTARGTRFERGPEPGRGYAVLVYAPESSPLGDRTRRVAAEKVLARAGYRFSSAASSAELARSLKASRPAVVVAAPADAPSIEAQIGRAALVVLPSPASADALLDAVDAAVRRIARAGVAAAARP